MLGAISVKYQHDLLSIDLPLEKLTLKVAGFKTEVDFITSVLQRSPHLTSLHVAGMRLQTVSCQSKLFTTLSGTVYSGTSGPSVAMALLSRLCLHVY